MKRFLAALLLALPIGLMAAGTGWYKGTFDQAKADAKAKDENLILKFYADW